MGISEFRRHWIWLAERAAVLLPSPAPFPFSLTAAVPSCCEAGACCWHGAALPSHTGILGDVEQLELILQLLAAAAACKEPETSFHLLAPLQQIKVV